MALLPLMNLSSVGKKKKLSLTFHKVSCVIESKSMLMNAIIYFETKLHVFYF